MGSSPFTGGFTVSAVSVSLSAVASSFTFMMLTFEISTACSPRLVSPVLPSKIWNVTVPSVYWSPNVIIRLTAFFISFVRLTVSLPHSSPLAFRSTTAAFLLTEEVISKFTLYFAPFSIAGIVCFSCTSPSAVPALKISYLALLPVNDGSASAPSLTSSIHGSLPDAKSPFSIRSVSPLTFTTLTSSISIVETGVSIG